MCQSQFWWLPLWVCATKSMAAAWKQRFQHFSGEFNGPRSSLGISNAPFPSRLPRFQLIWFSNKDRARRSSVNAPIVGDFQIFILPETSDSPVSTGVSYTLDDEMNVLVPDDWNAASLPHECRFHDIFFCNLCTVSPVPVHAVFFRRLYCVDRWTWWSPLAAMTLPRISRQSADLFC